MIGYARALTPLEYLENVGHCRSSPHDWVVNGLTLPRHTYRRPDRS